MAAEQQRLTPAERANLVAYIDHELNEAETRALHTKLTQSPTARREVEALERAWELLDSLYRPHASDRLSTRTLTEVQRIAVEGTRLESVVKQAGRRGLRSLAWVLGAACAFIGGYAMTQWVWPNPTARLARDLSIAEHVDEYRDVNTFEFLDELANSPEFNMDND